MPGTRTQLSLYVPEPLATSLESVRRTLDPVQSSLIPAHVTLCREDELAGLDPDALHLRLARIPLPPLTLRFGRPEPFHEHGILLPCIAGQNEFRTLREHVLGARSIRPHRPHITLAHPRNPKAPGNCPANAGELADGMAITFTRINVIEQTGVAPWRVVAAFAFTAEGADQG